MKVYIVIRETFESAEVLGVYSTWEKAYDCIIKAVENTKLTPIEDDYKPFVSTWECSDGDYYSIQGHIIDEDDY